MICFNKKASAIETANAAGFDLRLDQAESSKNIREKRLSGRQSDLVVPSLKVRKLAALQEGTQSFYKLSYVSTNLCKLRL